MARWAGLRSGGIKIKRKIARRLGGFKRPMKAPCLRFSAEARGYLGHRAKERCRIKCRLDRMLPAASPFDSVGPAMKSTEQAFARRQIACLRLSQEQ